MAISEVWAIMMVKDELDVIEATIEHLFAQDIDALIIADNGSTDGTLELINSLSQRLPIVLHSDPEVGYYQARKMSRLAQEAARLGATWILPCDADEIWYSWSGKTIATTLRECSYDVVGAPMWNHFCTGQDLDSDQPFRRLTWRQRDRNPLDKMAFRFCHEFTIAQGNHLILRSGQPMSAVGLPIGIRHFPYRSPAQFIRKIRNGYAAYLAAPDLPEDMGAHWRAYGRLLQEQGEGALVDHFMKWFHFTDPVAAGMIYDPAPLRWLAEEAKA